MQRCKESQLAAVGQTPCEKKTGAQAVRVLKNIKLPKQCVLDEAIYVAKRILCAETLLNDYNLIYIFSTTQIKMGIRNRAPWFSGDILTPVTHSPNLKAWI